jgi:peptidase E
VPLILTSNFPSTDNDEVAEWIRRTATAPRVVWIPPSTITGRVRFQSAEDVWRALGVPRLEYCDIDEAPDAALIADLDAYDVIYLSGGEPVAFRDALRQCGIDQQLRRCLANGRLIVAASGGAMQLTANVSLFRLLSAPVDVVVAERDQFLAMSVVEYEILPHFNTFDKAFVTKVRQYSEAVQNDILALADGAAIVHASDRAFTCIGPVVRIHGGVQSVVG